MSKNVKAIIRLVIGAGVAKPAPPVGPALGQAGLNIMQFCKDFNARTANMKAQTPIPVIITAYEDKTFEYKLKTPPVTYFIKQALGEEGLAKRPGHETVGSISIKHIYEIAKIKQQDQRNVPLESICRQIVASCNSMGVRVTQ